MKKFMLLTLSVALCFTACKKDDENPLPDNPETNPVDTTQTTPADTTKTDTTQVVVDLTNPNNYRFLKTYVDRAKHPGFKFSGALDVTEFNRNTNGVRDTVTAHFDEIVAGNAMKYGSVVNGSGKMDFGRVKTFVNDAKKAGLTIYGHTLAWHSQQQPSYLLGLMVKTEYEKIDSVNNYLEYKIGAAGENSWDHQARYNLTTTMTKGKNYTVKVRVRATEEGECSLWPVDTKSNNKNQWGDSDDVQYLNAVGVSTDWKEVSWVFSANFPIDRLQFVFGKMGGRIDFDDLTVTESGSTKTFNNNGNFITTNIDGWTHTGCSSFGIITDNQITIAKQTPLTAEQKRDTLAWAMDQWIAGMMEATNGYVTAWDVVNEALFGDDKDKDGLYDLQNYENNNISDPSNVSSGTFYWQAFMGDLEYVRTAVASARKHFKGNPEELKLFVNDYNLESDWDDNKKVKSLVGWINKWEADGVTKIDGIGTQMHISCFENASIQKNIENHIVKMFEVMAASGKLCRISELDMGYVRGSNRWGGSVKTSQLTEAEHKKMADFYEFIVKKYFEIIPVEQQYGICQWCLTDAPSNSGWRGGEPVGIWTEKFKARKAAYIGFANGLSN